MKVKDTKNKQTVEVADRRCLGCPCYWPRPDPGTFTQGKGYRSRGEGKKNRWLCGTREAHGCPMTDICEYCGTAHPPYETKCRECGKPLKL